MASQRLPSAGPDEPEPPRGDPWHAFGYLVSGVLVYGVLGWVLDRWIGTSWLVLVGILAGAGLGIYLTWSRFNRPRAHERLVPKPAPAAPEPDPTRQEAR